MSGGLARQIAEDAEQGESGVKAWAALLKRVSLLLEEEHYCAIEAPSGPLGPTAVAPWDATEEGLCGGRERLELPDDEGLADFLSRAAGTRLAYGYPTFAHDGALLPMFVVKARLAADGRAVLVERPETARLNTLALRRAGLAMRKALRLANELAESRGDFSQKLARAMRAVGGDPAQFAGAPLAELGDAEGPRWINRPILFSAPFDAERRATWNDLIALLKRPPWSGQARTALAALFGPSVERKAPLVFDLHALGPSQTGAVRTAMVQDVVAVEAAPGAGQMAYVANLIATATAANERVLYVAARSETAGQMARHMESWIARDRRVVVRLSDDPGAERDAVVDTLYRLAREDAQREPAEGQDKPQREKPTRRTLADLERFSPKAEPIAASTRQAHEHVRERHLLQRALAADLGPAWAGAQGRRAPLPATREQLAEWRARLGEMRGRAPGGLGKLMKNMLGGKAETTDVGAAIRGAVAKLPAEARAQMAELLADGSDQALGRALDRIARFCEWRAALLARNEAIRKLVRHHPDGRALEMQAMNHGAQKSAGAREIFRDEWRERLAADPLTLQKQVKALFDLFERSAEQPEARAEGQAAQRLAQAVRTVSSTMRIWTATPSQAQRLLPLEPGLFDLVIVDEADRLDLATALPLLFRAQRAVVVGAMRGARRDCPVPHRRAVALARTAADAPAWSEDPTLSLLAQVQAAMNEQGNPPCRLVDHFRSHPFIADLLNRSFYGGDLKVRTNFRSLRRDAPESMLGLRWRHVEGRCEAAADGLLNAGEVEAAADLLGTWRTDGVFGQAPRRSFAIVSPLPAQRRAIAARARRLSLPLERLLIAAPEELAGRVIDYLVMMPGLAADTPAELRTELAESEALYHDALASARLGVHVVGDRAACLAAGGRAAMLAAWADLAGGAAAAGEVAAAEPDWFDPTFDAAFGPAEDAKADAAAPLTKMLGDCGYAFQANVEEGGLRLAYRVLTPHGGRYDVEIDPSLEELAARPGALDRLVERDKAAMALGYQVVRFEPEELLGAGELLLERLQRLV